MIIELMDAGSFKLLMPLHIQLDERKIVTCLEEGNVFKN